MKEARAVAEGVSIFPSDCGGTPVILQLELDGFSAYHRRPSCIFLDEREVFRLLYNPKARASSYLAKTDHSILQFPVWRSFLSFLPRFSELLLRSFFGECACTCLGSSLIGEQVTFFVTSLSIGI